MARDRETMTFAKLASELWETSRAIIRLRDLCRAERALWIAIDRDGVVMVSDDGTSWRPMRKENDDGPEAA